MSESSVSPNIVHRLETEFDAVVPAPLSRYTSFQVGGKTPALVQCHTADQLSSLVSLLHREKQPYFVMGQGTNVLVSDEGVDAVVLRFCDDTSDALIQQEGFVRVNGNMLLDHVAEKLVEHGVGDLTYLSGIPGTLGGAIAGNAGAFGRQIGDDLLRAEVLSIEGNRRWVEADELSFAYRSSALKKSREIVLQADIRVEDVDGQELREKRESILQLRKEKHPDWKSEPCAGSVFRNIEPTSAAGRRQAAGWFLEEAGVKAFHVGEASLYAKHANIIIAGEGACAMDVYTLSENMKRAVKERFDIELVREVQLIGAFANAS
ncbi:MAG: UDP-N-acetylmuramate dehydrogenase [Kiritimatiellaceae bacterium]|nr:MAG: UDP-N-acetylmuramate dehydrogenase [Kiritimatiellaceae bacterium]